MSKHTDETTAAVATLPPELLGERLLDEAQAAAILNLSPGTLTVWRCTRRGGPAYIKCGRSVRYKLADLRSYVESQRVESPAE